MDSELSECKQNIRMFKCSFFLKQKILRKTFTHHLGTKETNLTCDIVQDSIILEASDSPTLIHYAIYVTHMS
jgi:hypothetical protein